MKLVKAKNSAGQIVVGIWEDQSVIPLTDFQGEGGLQKLLDATDVGSTARQAAQTDKAIRLSDVQLLAPIDQQEVWAAGVTYIRSKAARMEESEAAASCYDRVYVSDRPELFLKATPHRVVGPNGALRIRFDATWNVPEPELTLVLNSRKEFVGFTIGNDMSSRDIEGDNPLYLPQAKVYNQCAGLGPCITLKDAMPAVPEIGIRLAVRRNDAVVFEGETGADQMARSFEELIQWLCRENSFPNGAFLMTGTGIVPDTSFTLQTDDVVAIQIDGIGTLTNTIVQSQA
ncbi:MAG: fumarylacetoacetate hydrolase family protein [Planctomycetales bacterium]|nr:fumarylacetoacetate hydrolase family protein [Planctomycetales bacterium]